MHQPSDVLFGQIVEVARCDRWRICSRLQELTIPCSCPADGSLRVDVNHGVDLLLTRSVIQQFIASREELVHWLERCWDTKVTCEQNH